MRNLKPVKVGNCTLDGSHIYIQSMLNTRSDDIAGSVAQAVALEQAGCEIVRAAIPNHEAIALIPAIKEKISIPLGAGGRKSLPGKKYPHPHRRQLRLAGKRNPGKIRCAYS